MGAPAFISFPHFYRGDPRLADSVEGLSPPEEEEDYETYVDVHPEMGFAMRGKFRLQMNIQVRKSFGISQLDKFEDEMMLPVAWMELVSRRECRDWFDTPTRCALHRAVAAAPANETTACKFTNLHICKLYI